MCGHWLFSDALHFAICMSLKLRKENQVLPSFESLIGPFTVGVLEKGKMIHYKNSWFFLLEKLVRKTQKWQMFNLTTRSYLGQVILNTSILIGSFEEVTLAWSFWLIVQNSNNNILVINFYLFTYMPTYPLVINLPIYLGLVSWVVRPPIWIIN